MKSIMSLATIAFLLISTNANSLEFVFKNSKISAIAFKTDSIDGISSKSGEFSDLQDLKESSFQSAGARISGDKIFFDLNTSKLDIEQIYLRNGSRIDLDRLSQFAASGGDMGGGGK